MFINNAASKSVSPNRDSVENNDPNFMSKRQKRDIIKKRGKILEIKEINKDLATEKPTSPKQEAGMKDVLEANKSSTFGGSNVKKWMGPDQVTVETAFRYPQVSNSVSPKQLSPTSENLDGQLLHLESFQYKQYVEEYNRLSVERDVVMRRAQKQTQDVELAINATQVHKQPRTEMHITHPRFIRHDGGGTEAFSDAPPSIEGGRLSNMTSS